MTKLIYSHRSYICGQEFEVKLNDGQLILLGGNKKETQHIYNYIETSECVELIKNKTNDINEQDMSIHLLALIDALFSFFEGTHFIKIDSFHCKPELNDQLHCYLNSLWVIGSEVSRELFYQQQNLWLTKPVITPYPTKYITKNNHYSPKRPYLNHKILYQRYIPWLKSTLSFRLFDLEKDLVTFNKWMNDPEIDFFWEESGSLDDHREYINERLKPNSVNLPLIALLDDQPFGYFEVYWAKEDRMSIYYPVENFDRGWHVLIGDKAYRGKSFVSAWMPSISHYLFLDDSRTQRIVIEPRIDNNKMIKNLNKCGYAHLKTFNFPHKRAMLGMLERENFFSSLVLLPQLDK